MANEWGLFGDVKGSGRIVFGLDLRLVDLT